jgi:hypothetical protein
MKSILTGGVVTAALILIERYILRPHLTTEPQRCAARSVALNAGVGVSAILLDCPEAAIVHAAISTIGNATTYGACWLDERIAASVELAQDRAAAATPWCSPINR